MSRNVPIPDYMEPILDLLDKAEGRILEPLTSEHSESVDVSEIIAESLGQIRSSGLSDSALSRSSGGWFNIIPKKYGTPDQCREVLVVLVYASKTRATGRTSTSIVNKRDFEDLLNEVERHMRECPMTRGIIFWSISSWHPFIWSRKKFQFLGIDTALKVYGSDTMMI